MLGAENQLLGGAPTLPVDLGSLGMVGCRLGIDPLAPLSAPTDGTGFAFLTGTVPVTDNLAQMFFAQCLHTGNPALGLVTTNVAASQIGSRGLSTYLYNWDTFGPTAQYGPHTTNRASVFMLR